MSDQINIELLQRAKSLSPGEQIKITCSSLQEMEATRIALRRTKEEREKAGNNFKDILISRKSDREENSFLVLITKTNAFSEVSVVNSNGEEIPLKLQCLTDPEFQRICTLMEQDGTTKEEIEEYKKNYIAEKGE